MHLRDTATCVTTGITCGEHLFAFFRVISSPPLPRLCGRLTHKSYISFVGLRRILECIFDYSACGLTGLCIALREFFFTVLLLPSSFLFSSFLPSFSFPILVLCNVVKQITIFTCFRYHEVEFDKHASVFIQPRAASFTSYLTLMIPSPPFFSRRKKTPPCSAPSPLSQLQE